MKINSNILAWTTITIICLSFFNCKKEVAPENNILAKIVNADDNELIPKTNLKIVSYYYDGGFFGWGPPKSKIKIIQIQTGLQNIESPSGSCKDYHVLKDDNWLSLWHYEPYCAEGYDTLIFKFKQKIMANIHIVFQDSIKRSSCVSITRIQHFQTENEFIIPNKKVSEHNITINNKNPNPSFDFQLPITINDSLDIKISYRKNQLVIKHFKIRTTSKKGQSFQFKI